MPNVHGLDRWFQRHRASPRAKRRFRDRRRSGFTGSAKPCSRARVGPIASSERRLEHIQIRPRKRRQRRKPGFGDIRVHSRQRRYDSSLVYRSSMAVERHQRTRHRRVGTDLEYPRSHATRPRRILREARVSTGCSKSMKNIKSNKKELSPEQREELLRALKARFEKN